MDVGYDVFIQNNWKSGDTINQDSRWVEDQGCSFENGRLEMPLRPVTGMSLSNFVQKETDGQGKTHTFRNLQQRGCVESHEPS